MIVSISAVSAAEDIAADADLSISDYSTSLKVEESLDDIQADDESDKLDDSVDTGNNFTSLQSLIDVEEKELTLEKDYIRVDGIRIFKSIKISLLTVRANTQLMQENLAEYLMWLLETL